MKKLLPIILFNMICLTSMMAILPVVGPIVRELGLQEWQSGLIVSISGVFWMLLARFWGKSSDDVGRRKVLLIATSGFCLSYIIFSYFIDAALQSAWGVTFVFSVFIILRAIIGAFYAAIPTVSTARIADATSNANRSKGMALLGASSGIGMIAGPLLAGILSQHSLTLPLYVASFLPLIAIAIIFFALPRQPHRQPEKKPLIKFTDPRLRLPVTAGFLASSCVYFCNVCIGFYGMDVLALSKQDAAQTSGYAMMCVGVSMIVSQTLISKYKTIQPINWMLMGCIIAIMGFGVVCLLHTVTGLYLSYSIAAFGIGWIFPSMQTLASQSVSEEEQGIASGSVAAAQGLAMVIAPVVSTLLYEITPFMPYISAIVLLSLLFIAILKHLRLDVRTTS